MDDGAWETILIAGLIANAVIGLGYRIYRHRKGGPIGDVWGQAVLAVVLGSIAIGIAAGLEWLRWLGFGYALLFGLVAMPIWVLGVLLPLRPRAVDYGFTVCYWVVLGVIALAGILA